MPLTDPELDLLRELLAEDPAADVYPDVSRELMRRGQSREAMAVLGRALTVRASDLEAWSLLVEASADCAAWTRTLEALAMLGDDVAGSPETSRARVLALEGVGQIAPARDAARQHLERHGDDEVVQAALARLDAPAPDPALSASDPFVTVARAESFAAADRFQRAVRAYRRLVFEHPEHMGLQVRLRQLEAQTAALGRPQHSEELPVPEGVGDDSPPDLDTPVPALQPIPAYGDGYDEDYEDDPTVPLSSRPLPGADRVRQALSASFEDEDTDVDEEATQVFKAVNVEEYIQELKRKKQEDS